MDVFSCLQAISDRKDESVSVPKTGDIFRHYKAGQYGNDGQYVIVAIATMKPTEDTIVIYRHLKGVTNYARTMANWSESFERAGEMVPRFRRVLN